MVLTDFFGYQNEGYHFKLYGISHLIPMIIMVLLIILLYLFRDKIKNYKYEANIRYYLGALMILNQMAYAYNNIYITSALYSDGILNQYPFPFASVTKDLPLSLCGISMILTGFMMFNRSKKLFDILYFWVICGATLAILLPSAIANDTYGHFGPDKFRYYQFWIGHIGIVFIIAYMIMIWRYQITIKSFFSSYIWLVIFGLGTLVVNILIDANYLFMMNPDDTGLTFFPTYPYSIFIFLLLAFIFYILSYLPWYLKKKKFN